MYPYNNMLHIFMQSFSFVSLFEVDAENAQKILRNPRHFLPLCDQAAVKAQEQLCKMDQTVKTRV